MLTKGAIGNLINRYKAVLKKCHLLNTFGSLAVASMLVMGAAGVAMGDGTPFLAKDNEQLSGTYENQTNTDGTLAGVVTVNYPTEGVSIADDTSFINNSTEASAGGAAKIMNGITIGNNVTFSGNKAEKDAWGGGALYVKLADKTTLSPNGNVVIGDNAKFIGNEAGLGGAIALEYGNLSFGKDAQFEGNKATNGGAIAMWQDAADHGDIQSQLALNNATFTNNSATENGGAISAGPNSGSIAMNGATFTGNTANGQGGAIYAESENVTINGEKDSDGNYTTTFTGNSANQGGAIYVTKKSPLTVDGAAFNGNTATEQGGAIYTDPHANAHISNSYFEGNTAGAGGAVALWADGGGNNVVLDQVIENTEFKNNTAYREATSSTKPGKGGAVAIMKMDNTAAEQSNTTFKNVVFESNSSNGTGGAVQIEAENVSIVDSTFTGNDAGLQGGAVYNNAQSDLTFTGTNTFTGNTANGVGNDVHNAGTMTVESGVTRLDSGYSQEGTDSALNVNTGASLAIAMPDMGGVTASNDEALLALGQQLDLDGGTLRVGNVDADSTAQAAFGADSLFVVDGKAASTGPMITGSGAISVADGSQLYIANAQAGEAYTITDGLSLNKDEYWDSANLMAGRMVDAKVLLDGDAIVVKTEAQDAAKVLPGIIPVAALDTMVTSNLNDTDSSSMGIRFLSRAMDDVQFMPSDATATAMVNEVSRAAVTAGVQNTALRLADAGADQLIHHLSLSFFGKENNIHKDGVDVWATPMYGNTYTHGMVASGTAVRGNYGGITLGADAKVGEILGGKVRVGAAVNGGGGKSETRGTATSTDNEYNFGGVNLYAGWNLDNFNVMASVGYAMANHDVKMNLPAAMGMGQAKADVDTNAFIADLRAEYQINTDVVDILPHAGVRYTALNTESHDLKVNGSTLNSVASDTQHIVQFPIGVTVSKDIDISGWNVKPQADVSVIPAAGEKKNTTKVSYAGIGALDSVNTRIMDSTSWAGMVGVQAEKGNFALGLNYGVQASSHETDQSVSVGISWKF